MKKNKAFTLIELIAVLIIMAVVALIIAPFILNTIRRVKNSVNMRSIDGYGRAVEYAMANYQLKHLTYPDTFDELEIEYSGNKVECEISRINPDHTIYLSECKVNGKLVKNDKEFDGYYHYGILKMTNQEYVDTYGKNLEDALKAYHDEHNEYPSDYTNLELPPLDKEVSCDIKVNYNGTIYLTNCKVDTEEVLDDNNDDGYYHYGSLQYRPYYAGDIIIYNGISYYIIKDSDIQEENVTLLKKTLLNSSEISTYAAGTGATIDNNMVNFGTTSNYDSSYVKKVVENWAADKVPSGLQESRLITYDELVVNLGCRDKDCHNSPYMWTYEPYHYYMTMTASSTANIWSMGDAGIIRPSNIGFVGTVRPVIVLSKKSLE